MPIKFTPIDESAPMTGAAKPARAETQFEPLDGTFPFTTLASEEVVSKSAKNSGKLMIKLKLNVHGPAYDLHVYDYFADWFSEFKMKHFAEATGLGQEYASGSLDARRSAWAQRRGSVKLKVEDDPKYGAKSVVVDYIVPPGAKVTKRNPAQPAPAPVDSEDDVPF